MQFEVDFLPVGASSKSGDAIAIRYGNFSGLRSDYKVVTIDGGDLEAGDALVNLVRTRYNTNIVDFAILSHPDNDHASGFRTILEHLDVEHVLMHQPWNHSDAVKNLVDDDRTTADSLAKRAEKSLKAAKEAEAIALDKRIPITEPFAGVRTTDNVIHFIGPTKEFYIHRVANFTGMPGAAQPLNEVALRTLFNLRERSQSQHLEREAWHRELLQEPPDAATTSRNNSSTVILMQFGGIKLLFTGDVGGPGLEAAINYADSRGIDFSGLNFFQVPHHGSRKNIGPALLNRLFGSPRATMDHAFYACISCAQQGAPKHPNKKVINSLKRRGAGVFVTAGTGLHYSSGISRAGYIPAVQVPFYTTVDPDSVTA